MIRSTTKCVMIYDVWSTKIKVYNYVYSSKQVYIRYTIQQKNLAIDIKYCQIEDSHMMGKKTTLWLSHILPNRPKE